MYIVRKNQIERVVIVKKYDSKSLVKSGIEEILMDNNNIYNSREEANMAKKEIQITRDFKNKSANKQGYCVCEYCNKKIHKSSATIDHIIPLKHFGGRRKLREDIKKWEEAWDVETNIVIACKECNEEKAIMPLKIFESGLEKLERKAAILNLKKIKKSGIECYGYENNRKVGFGISTSQYSKIGKKHNDYSAMYLAQKDSRIIPLNLILSSTV